MPSFRDRLKDILIQDKLISTENFEKALDEQRRTGKDLSKLLIDLGFVSADALTDTLSKGLGLPQLGLSRYSIDVAILKLIPAEVASKYKILPISLLGNNLTIAMADPLNIFAIDNIKTITGFDVYPMLARHVELDKAIEKYYSVEEKNSESMDSIMKDIRDTSEMEIVADVRAKVNSNEIEELTDAAPIIKLTDSIIQQAVLAKASDIFIEPLEEVVRVRYRVDGVIREIDRMPKVLNFPMVSRIKVISSLDISEHRLPQDGRFKTIIAGNKEVDFRVSVLPTAMGEKICLRILDKEGGCVLSLDSLGLEPNALKKLKQCSERPHGMILMCGPTGSGKTTTMYSILNSIDSPEKNIVTVEDPVEYQIKGINQVNVKASLGLTFSSSLRSILRQDPDVIMIGEIRDSETLDIAVKAALTGHLVLSSLHTTTAAGSIIRMENMGIEPFLICSSVLAIVAQRLLRKVCVKCREKYSLSSDVAKKVGLSKMIDGKSDVSLFRAVGCKDCLNSGYKGRVGITEIMILSPSIKELILNNAGEIEIKNSARKEGMQTMRECALTKALDGLTTLEEVLRITAADEEKE
jgi:type IV pilus assembly protein PilB